MERLPPIPSRPGPLLLDLCHRFLPVTAFATAVALTAVLGSRHVVGTTSNPPEGIVAAIESSVPDRIVGYARRPLALQPRAGMHVEIRTRGPQRQSADSIILGVDPDPALLASTVPEREVHLAAAQGLAFLVEVPPGLRVHLGEVVDLVLRPSPASLH